MLVLARQIDQTVMIGDDIEVTVVDVRGDKVRLGINAPRSISVHRKEVWDAIRKENQASTNLKPQDLANLAPGSARATESPAKAPPAADEFMKAAIEEAKKGLSEGGVPIGAVLVRKGEIIAAGHNRRVQQGDPIAHAEIECLRQAGRQPTYKDTVLYTTLMSCYMCSAAVIQFGIPKVIVGESVNSPGAAEVMRKHGVQVVDLRDAECIRMMSDFIKAHPALWNEDSGK